ncbi:hypothetical protein Tco_1478350, partial [Tanacetum coccineum]
MPENKSTDSFHIIVILGPFGRTTLKLLFMAVKNLLPHVQVVIASSPDKNPSRKEVQVRVFYFSGTLSEGYQWKDRHGIGKTLCRVANSLSMDSTMSGTMASLPHFTSDTLNSQYVDRVKSLPRPLLPGAIVEPTKDEDTEMEQGIHEEI